MVIIKRLILASCVLASCVLASCVSYDARFGNCAVHCTDTTGCPSNLTCGEEGLCRAADAPVCIMPNDGMGGTITHVHGRTIHTFTVSQSGSLFTPPAIPAVELLVVAGGGGGGMTRGGGGGGGGGLVYVPSYAIDQPTYSVTVGHGGVSVTNGADSVFGTIVAIGGGAGRACSEPNGGSGGGASHDVNLGSAGTGTPTQGNHGGLAGNFTSMTFTGAGGGGAGGIGGNGTTGAGGSGGPGLVYSISGTQVYYAGGGGGGDQDFGVHGLVPGNGGIGGGGQGGLNSAGKDGLDGTGGGGGGGGGGDPTDAFYSGGRGGDGVVIISYSTFNKAP